MSNKESLRTFIYREAGSDEMSRVALLKHLAPLMRLYNVDSDAGTKLNCNDGAYEEVQQAKYSEAKLHPNGDFRPEILWQLSEKDMLVGHVVRSYNHSVQEGSAYPLLKKVAVHLRQMIADELLAVDFDGIVRHAYILDEHKAKWKAAADDWVMSLSNPNISTFEPINADHKIDSEMSSDTQHSTVDLASIKQDSILLVHGTKFVSFNDAVGMLAAAQNHDIEDEDTKDTSIEFSCKRHKQAMLSAIESTSLPLREKHSKTPFPFLFGNAQLSHNRIRGSGCLLVDDFIAYAKNLGVAVSVDAVTQSIIEKRVSKTKRTVWCVVEPYIKMVFDAGQYTTAKQLYKALQSKVTEDDSPFEVGQEANRGSLVVKELSKPFALKTLQNNFRSLTAA